MTMELQTYSELARFAALHQAKASSSAFYFTGEDALRVTTFNAAAGVTLAIEGRRIDVDGHIQPFAERHVPTTDRTVASTTFPLGEGFLLNVQLRATAGTPRIAQCFAILEVVRGVTGSVVPLATLVQGYVTDTSRLAWPGSPLRSSIDGPGVIRSIAGTDPAAGAEIAEVVPANARWQLDTVRVELVTDATVANRTVTLIVDDGATTLASVTASAAQAASLTRQYQAYASGGAPRLDGTVFYLPIPPELMLMGGFRVRTSTAGIVAGDNFGAPQLLVEEWIED